MVQGLPEWTLLGEYCGVWDTQAPSSEAEAEEDDCSALHDPIGLGPLLRDKVSELGYTSKAAPVDATNGAFLMHTSTARFCWLHSSIERSQHYGLDVTNSVRDDFPGLPQEDWEAHFQILPAALLA